jgi:Uncharacterised nucleotidyltransferase
VSGPSAPPSASPPGTPDDSPRRPPGDPGSIGARLVALSSPVRGDPAAGAAAAAVVSSADPDGEVDALYPGLLYHKTLPTAFAHLERAGGDLGSLGVSSSLYRALWPLNVVVAVPEESRPGRISLASIREVLDRHRDKLHGVVRELLELEGHRYLFIFGRSLEAAYPGAYPLRMDFDTDLFAPDLDAGLALLADVRSRMGFVLSRCKVSRLDGEGIAVFNLYRPSTDGHEYHLDIMVGAYLARGSLRPLWFQAPLWERARSVDFEGSKVLIPSAEDMVLVTAVKTYRRREINRRDVNDMGFLLGQEEGRLDWDAVVADARRNQVNGALHRLVVEASRVEGHPLAPPGALRRLRPGAVERRLLDRAEAVERAHRTVQTASGPMLRIRRQRLSTLWPAHWVFRYARARLGTLGALGYMATERVQRRMFQLQFRAARSGGRRPLLLPLSRAARPGFGSLCELRREPLPAEAGFCLSQTAAVRPSLPDSLDGSAREALEAVIAALPDSGAVERLSTTERGDEPWEPHRCGAYLFNFGRIHRPPR